MHNNLPFKPLLITVALASLFPMGVASASTYGIHANSQDLIIEDQNTFENVDYGVAAENGHTGPSIPQATSPSQSKKQAPISKKIQQEASSSMLATR